MKKETKFPFHFGKYFHLVIYQRRLESQALLQGNEKKLYLLLATKDGVKKEKEKQFLVLPVNLVSMA